MKPFNRNKSLVAGIVVTNNFNAETNRTHVWLKQELSNGKQNFVEVVLKEQRATIEKDMWLLVQGRIAQDGRKTFVEIMSDYDILGALHGGIADVQMNQYELSGNIAKIEHNDKGWTNISLAVKNWDRNAQPQETTVWCNLSVKTETITKLGLAKGSWIFVDCNCSTNKYIDNSGAQQVAYNFYINRVISHFASGNKTNNAVGTQQQRLPTRNPSVPRSGSFGVPSEAASEAPSI